MSCTLCILAAGLGSRFKGGIKQLEPFGPNGEIIMDYSIYDAVEAGFDKVVFIIRKDIRDAFDKMIGDRISKYVKIDYVYQELDCLPEGYSVPEGRVKPWGHGHAVCCCKGVLCNENSDRKKLHLGMAGFILKNTLSDFGAVNRGVCEVKDSMLTDVVETYNIRRENDGKVYSGKEETAELDENCYVSMNMWACPDGFIDKLNGMFTDFMKENKDSLTAEFLLPAGIDIMIKTGIADCKLLETHDKWFGVTYKEDKPTVKADIAKLIEAGVYPEKLWK